jgi:hypothetical protein
LASFKEKIGAFLKQKLLSAKEEREKQEAIDEQNRLLQE